jgi:hypothetical protein
MSGRAAKARQNVLPQGNIRQDAIHELEALTFGAGRVRQHVERQTLR